VGDVGDVGEDEICDGSSMGTWRLIPLGSRRPGRPSAISAPGDGLLTPARGSRTFSCVGVRSPSPNQSPPVSNDGTIPGRASFSGGEPSSGEGDVLCSADSDETLEALELRYASKMTASSVEASLSLRSSMCCGASSILSLSVADSRLSSLDWNSEDSSLLLRAWLEEP
jgi:hypothetical protein